jgi:4-amino-4-deoxy-L-arabinose transferase-like glycosyltransferase
MTEPLPVAEQPVRGNGIIVAAALGLLFLFTANIWGYDLWHTDENRFAQVPREMMQSGDYLAPHLNGQPYREKPPLLFWGIALVSAPFGDVSGESARAVLALAALAAVGFTYLLARSMFGDATAAWAALILATSWRFWWQARTVQIDMLLTACTTAALYMLWRWHMQRKRRQLMLLYLAIGLGMLAKGPPAMVFPLLCIITLYWGRKTDRRATHWFLGLGSTILILLAWVIPARMSVASPSGGSVEQGVLNNAYRQTLGRMFEGVSHAQPPWHYLTTLPVDLMPWTFFVPVALVYVWKQRRDSDAHRLLLAWVIPAIVFFSLSSGKRSAYLLPILPAFAVMLAAWWTANRERWSQRATSTARYVMGGVMVLYLLIAFVYFPLRNPDESKRDFCRPLLALTNAGQPYTLYMAAYSRPGYTFYSNHFHTALLNERIEYGPDSVRMQEDQQVLVDAMRELTKAAHLSLSPSLDAERYDEFSDDVRLAQAAWENSAAQPTRERVDAALTELAMRRHDTDPVFVIILERDLLWMSALEPELLEYTVLQYGSLGSRTLVLLGNPAATALNIQPMDAYRPAHPRIKLQHARQNTDSAPEVAAL